MQYRMDYAGIRLVGDDEAAVARLRGLLDFVGEPVREDINDVVMLVADRKGGWPGPVNQKAALILVGEGTPPGVPSILGRLEEPVQLAPLLDCLHRLHAFRRERRCSASGVFFGSVVGVSDAMAGVRALMAEACASESTVLIRGECGTGKDVVARAIHDASERRRGPFVRVDCGAIPPALLEGELFGYAEDGFPDEVAANAVAAKAVAAKAGRFELAARGTLFLDEIGDLPLPIQVKLLRAIQERRFLRLGGLEPRQADVRVIAATHRDLEAMLTAGTFRQDLYYQLNAVALNLPGLRERPEDIEPLIYAITGRILTEQGRRVRLTPDALQTLKCYPWPGNIRELKNLLERLAVEYPDQVVSAAELPRRFCEASMRASQPHVRRLDPERHALLPHSGLDLKDYLGRLERRLIEQALEASNSVVARAADRLHIRRTTLVEKMRKYGIERS